MTGSMPRYELGTEFFWTIELSGSTITTSLGKVGYDGHSRVKDHGAATEAKRQYDQLVAEKLEQGYVLVGAPRKAAKPKPKKSAKKRG